MFSFFKKKPDEPASPSAPSVAIPKGREASPAAPVIVQPAGKVAPAPEPAPPLAEPTTALPDTSAFFPVELAPADVSAMEEAAILYANEQYEAAVELLSAQVNSEPRCDEELWLMLLELYQVQNNKAAFDELALQFVVAFERTAPIWQRASRSAATGKESSNALTLLPSQLSEAGISKAIQQLQQQAQKQKLVQLDCSRVTDLVATALPAMTDALRLLRRQQVRVQLAQPEALLQLLQDRIEMMRRDEADIPCWLFLLECLQWQGDQEAFETLAVDYAVTYEVSPPSWEPLPKAPVAKAAPSEAPLAAPLADAFVLRGHYGADKVGELDLWMEHAEARSVVNIDCLLLERMDFVSAGHLLNLLVQLQQQGKELHLRQVSHLVGALFRVLGMHDFCKLHYRK